MKLTTTMLLFLTLTTGGCGGDDGPNDAPAKCETLVDLTCSRIVDCRTPSASNRAALIADCVTGIKQGIDCTAAVGVKPSYSACLTDTVQATCAAWTANPPTPPASCLMVIVRKK